MNSPDPENETSMGEPDRERIASRAYELWESQGRPDGRADDHWYEAEREMRRKGTQESNGERSRNDVQANTASGGGRHGPAPRSSGKPDRGTRPRPPSLDEATSGGESIRS